ncbi:WD40 repeat domain-containing protein [Streptacidiphilus rugosus]|uniref:WD40 repeat domain-containing protein n=1 Tax=Streptacidiphilus rugosus TaxID=405783 RepID=UPI0005655B98|nr:WD40 repeat domain-containing protein [Streptacidiphilus rugosus]
MERTPVPPLPGGRKPAGAALFGWLADPLAPRLCVVTGAPGSGKSHLLAWLTTACSADDAPQERRVHAMVPLLGLTVSSAVWIAARQLDLYARTPAQLVGALAADSRPTVFCLADLHRAGGPALPDEPRQVLDELVLPLLELPQVRIVVETDATTAALLREATGADDVPAAVMDLDAPQWTDAERFGRWYAGLPGAPATARPPAEAAYPSPGLARLAAGLGEGFGAGRPSVELLDRWWAGTPDAARPALAALATVDAPLTAEGWTLLVPDPEARRLVAELLPVAPSGVPLLSTALADHVRPHMPEELPQQLCRALVQAVPRRSDGRPDLDGVPEEHLTLLLTQTLATGQAQDLLGDPEFLVRADPHRITTALKATGATGPLAQAWAEAGPALTEEDDPGVRAEILRHRLHGTPLAPTREGRAAGGGLRTLWRLARGAASWPGPVTALAAGRAADGKSDGSLLIADATGGLHRLSLIDGSSLGRVPLAQPHPLRALDYGDDGSLTRLDVWGTSSLELPSAARTESELFALLRFGDACVLGNAAGELTWHQSGAHTSPDADGGADADRTERVRPHTGPVSSLAVAQPPGLPPLVFSGGADGTVRLWSPGAEPFPEPLDRRACPVLSVSVAVGTEAVGNPLTLAVSWADGLVRLLRFGGEEDPRDLRLGAPVLGLLLLGPNRLVLASAEEVSVVEPGG